MKRYFLIFAFVAAIISQLSDSGASIRKSEDSDFLTEVIYEELATETVSASGNDIYAPRPTNYSAPLRNNSQAKRVSRENIQPLALVIAGKHTCITNFRSYFGNSISCISGMLRPENYFIGLRKLII